jgi:hypothetical protein
MGIIEEINDLGLTYNKDDSLASILEKVMEKQLIEQPFSRDYYYVTHLINPAQAFFQKKYPKVKKPPKLGRRLALGKQLHNYASWFRTLPGFTVDEGTIDGAWVGIPGVRGKIDYRIGDSLIEFKTKDDLPNTIEEVIKYFPQDLEQLAFYSIIHPKNPLLNYLVFMKNSTPYELKALKVQIKDSGTIKSIIISRKNALDKALKNNDPSFLGRCRYYNDICQFKYSRKCTCEKLKPWDITGLLKAVDIDFDEDYTFKLEETRKEYMAPYTYSITTRDIIAPRKHYMEAVLGLESIYGGDEKEEFKACIWSSVTRMKKNHKIDLSNLEKQKVIESQLDPRLRIGFRWLKIQSSTHPEGEILPYILNVNLSDNPALIKSFSLYHKAELGIICAAYGKNKGLFIRVFPNMNKLVQVFQVKYDNKEQILKMVKGTIDKLELAKKKENPLLIPSCPSYFNDEGKCPMMVECHSEVGIGCVPEELRKD